MAQPGSGTVSDLNKLKKFLDTDYRASYLEGHVSGSIAYQVQALRGDLTQTEFGALVNMPQPVISRIENEETSVNITTLLKIANHLGVGLSVRFCGFETLLAEDISPSGLAAESIQSTVDRLSSISTAQNSAETITLSVMAKKQNFEGTRTWQTNLNPSQQQPLVLQGPGTQTFGMYTPTQAALG